MAKRVDLLGERFGKLVVVERLGPVWRCRCDCGGETTHSAGHLRYRSKKQSSPMTCGCGCYKKGPRAPKWRGHGEISARFWKNIETNSRSRDHAFEVTIEDAWGLFQRQNGRCALTGDPISFPEHSNDSGTASLDRVDSSRGYVLGNIQWVHKAVNVMKWDLSLGRFLELCSLVVHPEVGLLDLSWVPTKRHGNWKGHGGITGEFWDRYPRNAEARGLVFDLSMAEAWELFLRQQGRCALTGIPLVIGQTRATRADTTASLDRIRNAEGYTATNIQWVHKDVNAKLRRHLSLPEVREWAAKVVAGPGCRPVPPDPQPV